MKEFTRNVLPYVPAFRRFASGHAADIGSADALVMIALKTLKARWMFLGFVGLKIEGYGLIHSLADDKAAIFDDADSEPIPEYDRMRPEKIDDTRPEHDPAHVSRTVDFPGSRERLGHT